MTAWESEARIWWEAGDKIGREATDGLLQESSARIKKEYTIIYRDASNRISWEARERATQ